MKCAKNCYNFEHYKKAGFPEDALNACIIFELHHTHTHTSLILQKSPTNIILLYANIHSKC